MDRILGTHNARRTISDIAACVNLSPAPVRRRIDRLEQAGVIASYTVVTDLPAVAPHFEAFTEVKIDGDADPDEVIAGVTQIPEVLEVFTTAGDLDALVRIRVDNVDHLRRVVGGHPPPRPGVGDQDPHRPRQLGAEGHCAGDGASPGHHRRPERAG